MTHKKEKLNKMVIYQNSSGAIELRGDIKHETIWATQAQIAELFNVERSVITKHIRNILKDKELDGSSVCANFAHTAKDNKTYQVQYYNLDVILSVGYRTNSKVAISFRQWATKTLRNHITKGFTINRKQIANNYDSFMKAVSGIEKLLPENSPLDSKSTIELIKSFANAWVSLGAYDRETIKTKSITKRSVKIVSSELLVAINEFKKELIRIDNETDLFAKEMQSGIVDGIVGNVMQTFNGKALYESIEEKAAHLLYFMIKNHPFVEGNKRTGAFTFVWFLAKNKIKGLKNINSAALASLTLLVAASNPKDKDLMIALITQFLAF